MKRFVNSKPAMLVVAVACGLALMATMTWTYSVGVSVERVIAMIVMSVGLISTTVRIDAIEKGRLID